MLTEPWICDVDVTVKTLYGHQEGAEVGYNPHKPGRASHAYHTFFVSRLRLALDVVVVSGKKAHSQAVSAGLWSWWEQLPAPCRPELMRMDCGFGNEGFLVGCEQRNQKYLSRLRLTKGVQEIIRALSGRGGWKDCAGGWQGLEGQLRLKGWTRPRRIIVLRRRCSAKALELGPESGLQPAQLLPVEAEEPYEYTVLVTNTDWEALTLARLYRERADSENTIDELKGQWGWGGFVTKDLLRCQVARAQCGLDLQLVEFVCSVRGTISAPRSGDQPPLIDVCGRPTGQPCRTDDGDPDQHPWRSRAGAGDSDQCQPVFERPKE